MSNAIGIDVSYANAGDTTSPTVDFVIARATYGTQRDSRYLQHIASAKRQGKVTGAYGFGVYGPGVSQAIAFLAAAGKVGVYALDLEAEKGKPRMTDTQAKAFIAYVKYKLGKCLLYHSDYGFPSLGQTGNWVAKWGDTMPARPWKFWQYRGGPLDRDMFHGTLAELHAFVGDAAPAPSAHYLYAYLTEPSSLWNPDTQRWVYSVSAGHGVPKGWQLVLWPGTRTVGGRVCYRIRASREKIDGVWHWTSKYAGYWVPARSVKVTKVV